MININELKACMVSKGMTQKMVAKAIGMSADQMSRRMVKGVFGTDEAERLIEVLEIKDPAAIFFAKKSL